MRKKILVIVMMLFLYSCQDLKNNIEVIPNVEWEYLDENSVTEPAIPTNSDFEKQLEKTLFSIVKNWYSRNGEKVGIYPIVFTIFINESGEVEKIKDGKMVQLSQHTPIHQRNPSDTVQIFKMDEEIIRELLPEVQNWSFKPAYFTGSEVKYKMTVKAIYTVNPKFVTKFDLMFSNLNSFSNHTQDFLVAAEEMPEPIGGIKAIQEKIIYPEIAKRAGIEGRVYIKALINENGDVAKAEVIKGIGAGCDEMAIDAVRNTKFIPGRQRGEAVKVQVSIPILFKLSDDKFKGKSKILGKWEGKSNKGEKIKISFFNDGLTNLYKSQSGIMDGKRTGATFAPTYKIDSSSIPYKLDLVLKEHNFSKSLLKFITRDSIIIGRSINKNIRPKNFNTENIYELWNLKRAK